MSRPMGVAPPSRASRPPADHRCLLFTLADIEIQLVCHYLLGEDIIGFAQTSKRIHHAADLNYAWENAMLPLTFCREPFLLPSRGLRRHARVALKWLIADGIRMPSESEVQRLIDALPPSGLLRSFDVRDYPMRQAMWIQLINHPSIQKVTELHMHERRWATMDAPLIHAVLSLPRLRALSCCPFEGDPAPWAALSSIPELSWLHLADTGRKSKFSRLPHISLCPSLTHLSLVSPAFYGPGELLRFFSGASIQRLWSLELDNLDLTPKLGAFLTPVVPPRDIEEAFAGMKLLKRLRLRWITNLVALIPCIADLPALQLAILEPLLGEVPSIRPLRSAVVALLKSTASAESNAFVVAMRFPGSKEQANSWRDHAPGLITPRFRFE